MKAAHVMLAVLVAAIWGLAFVATKLGLDSFSPPQLTALRFLIAALPILVLPRPAISWLWLVVIGLFLFTGQFLLLFFGMALGMPPGLASITMQMQAFFTIGIAAVALRDLPNLRQTLGISVAFLGLVLIAGSVDGDVTYLGSSLKKWRNDVMN